MTPEELQVPTTELEIATAIDAIRRECTGHDFVVGVIRRMAFELHSLRESKMLLEDQIEGLYEDLAGEDL